MKLGEMLVRDGRVTEAQMHAALAQQGRDGGRVGTVLVEMGLLDLDTLTVYLGLELGIPIATGPTLERAKQSAVRLLTPAQALRLHSIPLIVQDRRLIVAMEDPHDLETIDEMATITGYRILPRVAPEIRIFYYLERYYGVPRASRFSVFGETPRGHRRMHADPELPSPPLPGLPPKSSRPIRPPTPPPVLHPSAPTPLDDDDDVIELSGPTEIIETTEVTQSADADPHTRKTQPMAAADVEHILATAAAEAAAEADDADASEADDADADDDADTGGEDQASAARDTQAAEAGAHATDDASADDGPAEPSADVRDSDTDDDAVPRPVDEDATDESDAAALQVEARGLLDDLEADDTEGAAEVGPPLMQTPEVLLSSPSIEFLGPETYEPVGADDTIAAMEQAARRGDVARAIMAFAAHAFDTAALCVVRDNMAFGWKAIGPNLDRERIEALLIPLEAPSMFQSALNNDDSFHAAPFPATLHTYLYKVLRCPPARTATVVAIRIGKRVVNFLYGHRGERDDLDDAALDDVNRVCQAASAAYVRLITATKQERSGPVPILAP